MTAEKTAAPTAPIEAFRATREEFFSDVQSAVSGLLLGGFGRLEEAIIERDYNHSRELAVAHGETAAARAEIERLNRQLAEHAETAEAAIASSGADGTAEADSELSVKLDETQRELDLARGEVQELGQEVGRLQVKLEESGEEIARLKETADQPVDTKALDELRGSVSSLQTQLEEANLRARIDRTEAASEGRAGALRTLEAIAADNPALPVSEAVSMAAVALSGPVAELAQEPAGEAALEEFPPLVDAAEGADDAPPFIAVWEAPTAPANDEADETATTTEFVLGDETAEVTPFVFADAESLGEQADGEPFFAMPPEDGTYVLGSPAPLKDEHAA